MSSDSLTVLTSVNRRLASKTFSRGKDGKIKNRSYGNEKYFAIASIDAAGIVGLARSLEQISRNRHAFIVRGEPVPGIDKKRARRLLHPDKKTGEPATFAPASRRWFLADVDKIACPAAIDPKSDPESAVEYVIGLLPPELHDASCVWRFSSSQSVFDDLTLSVHLWFWSETPLDEAALKRWAISVNTAAGYKLIDPAPFSAVQAHYVALPEFVAPLADPLRRRCGLRQGLDEAVSLIIPEAASKKHSDQPSEAGFVPGEGVAAYLAMIGGPIGNREAVRKAIGSYISIYGGKADCGPLKTAIRDALDRAVPGWRDDPGGQRYVGDDHLDQLIEWTRRVHGDQPPCDFIPEPPDWLNEAPPPEPPGGAPPRPLLRIVAGELPAVVDAAEQILIERDHDLYEFGDQIMRPALSPIRVADNQKTTGLRLLPVRLHHLIERFTRAVDFRKYSRTRKEWEPTDCPEAVANAYLERAAAWRLPKLAAITCCPLLLSDGRILARPGFDAPSGILFDPQGVQFPPVPQHPTRDDARKALDTITALFAEFPFVDGASRSVMWSAILSAVARPAFDFAPLHGFDAPLAGTGKSKLVDCCVILVTGHECPVISQADDETEFEKRLGAQLLEGDRLISVDNCDAPLGGQLLCQTATQTFLKIRVLGFSKTVTVTNATLIFATGNNLMLYGDMLRRGLIARLDAGVERPELRSFAQEDPVRVLKRDRGRYVAAALTVLHAYNLAGRPDPQPPLGGFEEWSALVRDALVWLGEADPVETIEEGRKTDPDRQRLEAVVTQWSNVLGNRSVTTRTVIEEACGFTLTPTPSNPNHLGYWHPEFRNALLDVANDRGHVSAMRLGKWIGANKLKVVGNHRLAATTISAGNARWRLEERQADGRWL